MGQNAAFKMPFSPQEMLAVNWFRDGTEIKDGGGVKIVREPNHSRLLLKDCLRTDAGEIKIQLKNPFGAAEATSQLIVIGIKNSLMQKKKKNEGYYETDISTICFHQLTFNHISCYRPARPT